MRLGAWLLSKGKITEDQLQRALQHREFFGGRIGSSLIALGYIDEDVLGAYLSDVAGTPYAPAARLEHIPPETIALVPARLAAQYRVIPIALEGRRLKLAMRDPRDLIALDEIAFMTGMTIEPLVSTDFRIQKGLARYYQVAAPTEALPLAGGMAAPSAPSAAASTRPRPPVASGPGEVGFDGYPIDADPEQIDNPLLRRRGGASPGGERETAAPNSLEQWRQAQEEIPDQFPEPATAFPSSPRLGPITPTLAAAMSPPSETFAAAPAAVSFAPTFASPFAPAPAAPPIPDSPAPPPRFDSPAPAHSLAPAAAASDWPAPSFATPAPAVAPVTPPIADPLDDAAARLQQADTRDGIFEVILGVVASRFRRAALFVVHSDRVTGWSGRGPGLDPQRLRGVTVPFDRPSLFAVFKSGADFYHGPVSDLPANSRFFLDLGIPVPERVLVMPLVIKDRPTVVLYADHGLDNAPAAVIPDLRRLLAKAALALEILILRRKITTL
ncbi:MAG TPA: hypothetical protein VMQ62_06965 [Dongiaceae bacterium]|nr:hypothetical protein [Dongiaceae bacterium]